ncbi:hypothetical protein MLD38_029392 [Melastoma candidum]|uniref:Uncharacterized protein n=1 Tax=Melastoma candidum TaxID=119954 RepID=A0ACB9N3L3_9MYRT|nr:hypothetical protein MLD38_029392 [Melastoma candidum]
MVRRRWLCPSSTRGMLVKIVHPGGHIELHDSPILAAEIMHQNPKCCVAYPHVFQEPWAIVAPDTVLMLGEKFYVVPINTVRKLQRHSLRYSPSMLSHTGSPSLGTPLSTRSKEQLEDRGEEDGCQTKDGSLKRGCDGSVCFSKDGWLIRLLAGLNVKDKPEEWSEDSKPSSSFGSSETGELMRRKWKGNTRKRWSKGSTKRRLSTDWRPNLESINEEKSTSNL